MAVKEGYRKRIQTEEEVFWFFFSSLVARDTSKNIFSIILLGKVRKHLLSSLNSQLVLTLLVS